METIEIDKEEANQILIWWSHYDGFGGQMIAKKLEDFLMSNQSSTTKEEKE